MCFIDIIEFAENRQRMNAAGARNCKAASLFYLFCLCDPKQNQTESCVRHDTDFVWGQTDGKKVCVANKRNMFEVDWPGLAGTKISIYLFENHPIYN